jgi:hypothetical protein
MAAETFLRDDRISLFRRCRLRPPAIARDFLIMDDNVVSDPRRREELALIKTFLGITDPGKRQRILELAEQLADESDAAGLAFASADASLVDTSGDAPGQVD